MTLWLLGSDHIQIYFMCVRVCKLRHNSLDVALSGGGGVGVGVGGGGSGEGGGDGGESVGGGGGLQRVSS